MEKLKAGGLSNIYDIHTAGVNIGFKQKDKDFALIYIPDGGTVSGMFTKKQHQRGACIGVPRTIK